jgi:hypothetical protein
MGQVKVRLLAPLYSFQPKTYHERFPDRASWKFETMIVANLQLFTSYYALRLLDSGMLLKTLFMMVVDLHAEYAFVVRCASLASSARCYIR